jgi:cell division protein FtsX
VTAGWTWRRLRREAREHLGSLVILGAAMAFSAVVAGAAVLGGRTAAGLVPLLEQNVHVIAYLDDQMSSTERSRLLAAVRLVPDVAEARLVEPEEAMAHLRAAAGSLGGAEAVAPLEPGFLPRSIEIAVAPSGVLPARAAQLADRLRKLPGVREVDSMSEGVARILSWIALGRRVAWGALAVAVLAALAALALAVFAGRGRRREEGAVLALLGESPAGLRRPACLAAATAALIGAGAGLVTLLALYPRALHSIEAAVGLGQIASAALGRDTVLAVLAAALLLGWVVGRLVSPTERDA